MAEGKVAWERWIVITVFYPHTAPTGDETLTEGDVALILEELMPAMNQAYVLAVLLKRLMK